MTNIAAVCENSDALLLRYSFKDRNCKHQHCHNNHHTSEWTSWKWCNVQTVSGANAHENGQHDDLYEGAVTQSSRRPPLVYFPYLVFVCSLIATRTITSYLFPFNDKTNVLKIHFNIILPPTNLPSDLSSLQVFRYTITYKPTNMATCWIHSVFTLLGSSVGCTTEKLRSDSRKEQRSSLLNSIQIWSRPTQPPIQLILRAC